VIKSLLFVQGLAKLPGKEKMWEDVKSKHAAIKYFYVDTMRHKIHYDWITHLNEVADEIGCRPDISKRHFGLKPCGVTNHSGFSARFIIVR